MLRAVLRDMRAHPGRIAMTLVAIVIGVAFVVATWVVSDSAAASFVQDGARTDLAVRVTPATPDPLDDDAVRALSTVAGKDRVTAVSVGYTALVRTDGKLSDTHYPGLAGTGWDSSGRFTLRSGRGPANAGEVALEEEAAGDAGLAMGATARLLDEQGRSTRATVVGIFVYHKASAQELTPAVAYDPDTARARLGPGYAWVDLTGPDEQSLAGAATRVLGGDRVARIRTGTELAAELADSADRDAQTVRNFLLAFAGVALFAGMFVIANTFTMLVAQRTRHFALLRAVGARRVQVRRAILAEAGVLGLVGATLGVASGLGLGWLAMTLLRASGATVVFTVSPVAVVVGYLVGLVVTVIAAYGSARRGALVPPVAALGTDASLPRRSLAVRTVAGLALVAAGVALVVATSGSDLSDLDRATGMGGALLGCVGVLLLAPLLASAVLAPLARLASRRGSALSRLALRNAIRDPRRTAATASALMIGLTLVTAFATVGASFTAVLTEGISGDVPADASVVRSAVEWSSLPSSALDRVRGMSNVDSVAAPVTLGGEIVIDGQPVDSTVTGVEPAGLGTALTPRLTGGTASLAGGGVLVPADFADRFGIRVGDAVTVTAGTAALTGRVSGIYGASEMLRGVVVDKALLPAESTGYVEAIFVTGADPAATRRALDAAFADHPDIVVMDRGRLIDQYTSTVDLALNIIYGLLGAAVVVAVFGVVNTMALSVLERTREIGVFRAVGATRRSVRRTVRRESIVIATYGGLLGVGLGVLLGGVMQHVLLTTPILGLTVPLSYVAGALAGMVVVGALAAWWPARRAARTDILTAIAAT